VTSDRSLPTVLDLVNAVAPRAIVVGDPGRALTIAQQLLERPPLMCNHRRGLWGYTGVASDGAPLTVQSTGVGGASAVPVVRELAVAGVTRMVRAGSALPLGPEPASDDAVQLAVVTAAVARDGASRALGVQADARLTPDPELTDRLAARTDRDLTVVSVDLLPQDGGVAAAGAAAPRDRSTAIDRQTAAFLAAAARWDVTAAAVVALPRAVEGEQQRERWWQELGAVAAGAYGLTVQPPTPRVTSRAS
jgi:purine-nucleoside phosphorylase